MFIRSWRLWHVKTFVFSAPSSPAQIQKPNRKTRVEVINNKTDKMCRPCRVNCVNHAPALRVSCLSGTGMWIAVSETQLSLQSWQPVIKVDSSEMREECSSLEFHLVVVPQAWWSAAAGSNPERARRLFCLIRSARLQHRMDFSRRGKNTLKRTNFTILGILKHLKTISTF